jgi:PhoH-like ATPase
MPLPKLPTKPAALLSTQDYPKADKDKIVKSLTLIEPVARKAEPAPAVVRAKIADKIPAEKLRAAAAQTVAAAPKAGVRRPVDKSGIKKLFVLDTNVLMHDPTSLFRFEEHDVYLPMMTLEELDDHKKGMSEVARSARQVSRSLDALVSGIEENAIDEGIPLSKLGNKDAKGRLFFQTKLQNVTLPEGLPMGKADNQILGVVRALESQYPGRPIVLVSKDINMRIKARAMGLPAEEYFNDHVLEDTDLLYSGIMQLPDDFWV